MLSTTDTIEMHRKTRTRYMLAANFARYDDRYIREGKQIPPSFAVRKLVAVRGDFLLYPRGAMLCFIKYARRANWRLVAVKRFARQYAHARNLLLTSDDESTWGE